eukprot:6036364-Prymnesium_polylepis.1
MSAVPIERRRNHCRSGLGAYDFHTVQKSAHLRFHRDVYDFTHPPPIEMGGFGPFPRRQTGRDAYSCKQVPSSTGHPQATHSYRTHLASPAWRMRHVAMTRGRGRGPRPRPRAEAEGRGRHGRRASAYTLP